MVCAQVVGNDATIAMGGQSGNFQLNVMLPVVAYNLLQSAEIVGNGATLLADKAKASGITVGLEFVNRYESNLLNTSAQTVEYIREVGSDNLVVHLDSYHMNIEENDFRQPVFDAGDLLGYVHIGENHRGYLGQGHVDFAQLFGALVEAGYDGVITFESFSSKVVDEDLTTTLRIWRNMWENSMDLAVQARRYMGEEMAKAGAK